MEEKSYYFKPYEELTFTDGFMFYLTMQDKEICKGVIERLLGIKIKRIEYVNAEHTMKIDYNAKSIRLDVYAQADDKIYDVEIQTYDENDIGKRLRYYQSVIDIDCLKKGEYYSELKESIIIFISTKDILGKGLPRYTFSNICHENKSIELNDKSLKVIYNLKSDFSSLSENEKELLNFMSNGNAKSDFTKKIDNTIQRLKKQESWRRQYMTWEMTMMHERREGIAEGIQQGAREKAIEAARNLIKNNVDINIIANSLEISIEEVKQLQAEMK